ncbi:MAG TPA: protein-export chaperone SecB [Candidatus Limadaptatus stercorigallinarum]|uniref:Protein-export chaperone SecB n=1 Tax=Candidatus Limadaptatus stercorigallinarum TaxID=2840845 RepID=A0A9D1L1K2_9FIRM|nr:protein-export chaperone SecB [Candidatus Limadaptatus stercorigallinarum]
MNVKEIKADMEMKGLYFNHIEFKRTRDITNGEVQIDITPRYEKEENINRIVINTKITKQKEMSLVVEVIGEFVFNSNIDDMELQNKMMRSNAVAMMLPFIRAMVTQITAQPNLMPIIIPTINASRIIEKEQQ